VELDIVLDVIVVNFGADKDVGQAVPNVIADPTAKVFHEVIAAGVVDAAGDVTRGQEIESGAGDANASKEIEAEFLAHTGLEERVDVGEDRAIGLAVARVVGLMISPSGFCVKAEVAFLEADVVTAYADVSSAFLRGWHEVNGVAVGGGRHEGATADHDVHLLCGSEAGKQKNSTRGYE
jgi:hypothetical protein